MATYRLPGVKINEEAVAKQVSNMLARVVRKYEAAGNAANKEIREDQTIEWFSHSFGGHADEDTWDGMIESLVYDSRVAKNSKNGGYDITFISYFNPDRYNSIKSSSRDRYIYTWKDKYGAIINPAELIFGLQWDHGILGLPHKWSRPNPMLGNTMINPHFMQTDPSLEDYLIDKYRTLWTRRVNNYVK